MGNQKNILERFDFEGFIVNINNNNLSDREYLYIKNEIEGKIDIENLYFSGDYASIYFKSITSFDNDRLKEICQLHKSVWNQRKVPFLYVSTPTELRIYNCFEEPLDPNKDLNKINKIEIRRYSTNDTEEHLKKIIDLFGRVAIDSGDFWRNEEIIQKFRTSKRVDNVLVQNLKDTKIELEKRQISIPIIHDLLTRSLFILYLEDIGATDAKYYSLFKKDATSYFHILTDRDATYKFYKQLEEKFNGDLFDVTDVEKEEISVEELRLIASCFWGDEVSSGQLILWKKFDFSVIPIELLSEIYEIFLNTTDKGKYGEYYTPHSLVDLILNESLPWADTENKNYSLKILDLACGSGIFLVEGYRRLVDRWKYSEKKQPEFKDLENILVNSIYGFEINWEAIKVAAFSLYLALISYLNPKTIWQQKGIKFPHLIYEPERIDNEEQGKNLFHQSSLSNIIEHQPDFDLVLGNPPFKSAKTGSIEPEASEYCKKYGFAQEMVLPFLHRAKEFCNETGNVSIISTSKILFNTNSGYQKFRKFLFNDNYVETVLNLSSLNQPSKGLGKKLFVDAIGPSCVLFYKKNTPEKQKHSITYICPKPTGRDQFSDDLILDVLDFYYLPRKECQKPNTVIWKTAMWGTENDFQLIQTLLERKPLNHYLTKEKGWYKGGGFQFLSNDRRRTWTDTELANLSILEAKNVKRYTSSNDILSELNETLSEKNLEYYLKYYKKERKEDLPNIHTFRMVGNKKAYFAPHILIKEGQSKQSTVSYLDFDCSFKHTITGITFKKEGIQETEFEYRDNLLKGLTAFLNSKLSSYYLFLTSMSWGIDIRRVTANDLFKLPGIPFEISKHKLKELANKVDEISFMLKDFISHETEVEKIENEINSIIYDALNLSKRDIFLIEDILKYGIETYHEGGKSPSYYSVNENNDELKAYLEILCEDFNEHFEFSGTTVWASIWKMPTKNPMRLVAIHFTKEHEAGHVHTFPNSSGLNELINKIDKYSYEKYSASVYFRKVVKYYEGDIIYIIKPNQKRFWSRSQAMQDSNSILLEITNID